MSFNLFFDDSFHMSIMGKCTSRHLFQHGELFLLTNPCCFLTFSLPSPSFLLKFRNNSLPGATLFFNLALGAQSNVTSPFSKMFPGQTSDIITFGSAR